MATIEDRIQSLETAVAQIRNAFAAATGAKTNGTTSTARAAPSVDLDSERGDFVVKKDPTRWKGVSCVGKRLSECPPDFLDALAGLCDWKAEKNEAEPGKEKYANYERLDAARARGWAERLRGGYTTPTFKRENGGAVHAPLDDANEDGVPF